MKCERQYVRKASAMFPSEIHPVFRLSSHSMQPTVQCPKICSAQSDGGGAVDCSQLLAGRRAVHTFLIPLPRFTVQESNGVCCVDRDSFQEKREEEESGARSERVQE